MGFEGDLKNLSLGDVFQNIQANSLTGTLVLEAQDHKAYLLFEGGLLVGYAPEDESQRPSLADILLKRQVIDEAALEKAQKKKGRRELRTYLAEEGIVSEEDQRGAYRFFIEEATYEIFTWKEAHFRFEDGPHPKGLVGRELDHLKVEIQAPSILMEAARRADEWDRIRRKIPSFREVFVSCRDIDDSDLEEPTEVEAAVAALLDGTHDLDTVIERLPHGKFAVAQAAASLLASRRIKPIDAEDLRSRADEARGAGKFEDAARLYERSLALERGSPEARTHLAEILERLGKKAEAAEQWKQLGYLLVETGKKTESLEAYRQAASLAPSDVGLHETLFDLLREAGRTSEAIEVAKSLGRAALDQHLYDKAIACYKTALDLGCDRTALRRLLAEAHLKKSDLPAAIGVLRMEARDLLRTGDLDASAALFRRLLELQPDDPEAGERLTEIQSGLYLARRQRRRRILKFILAAVVAVAVGIQAIREILAQAEMRSAYPELARTMGKGEDDDFIHLVTKLAAIRRSCPYTMVAVHVGDMLDALAREEVAKAREVVRQGGRGSFEPGHSRRRLGTLRLLIEGDSELCALVDAALADLPSEQPPEAPPQD